MTSLRQKENIISCIQETLRPKTYKDTGYRLFQRTLRRREFQIPAGGFFEWTCFGWHGRKTGQRIAPEIRMDYNKKRRKKKAVKRT